MHWIVITVDHGVQQSILVQGMEQCISMRRWMCIGILMFTCILSSLLALFNKEHVFHRRMHDEKCRAWSFLSPHQPRECASKSEIPGTTSLYETSAEISAKQAILSLRKQLRDSKTRDVHAKLKDARRTIQTLNNELIELRELPNQKAVVTLGRRRKDFTDHELTNDFNAKPVASDIRLAEAASNVLTTKDEFDEGIAPYASSAISLKLPWRVAFGGQSSIEANRITRALRIPGQGLIKHLYSKIFATNRFTRSSNSIPYFRSASATPLIVVPVIITVRGTSVDNKQSDDSNGSVSKDQKDSAFGDISSIENITDSTGHSEMDFKNRNEMGTTGFEPGFSTGRSTQVKPTEESSADSARPIGGPDKDSRQEGDKRRGNDAENPSGTAASNEAKTEGSIERNEEGAADAQRGTANAGVTAVISSAGVDAGSSATNLSGSFDLGPSQTGPMTVSGQPSLPGESGPPGRAGEAGTAPCSAGSDTSRQQAHPSRERGSQQEVPQAEPFGTGEVFSDTGNDSNLNGTGIVAAESITISQTIPPPDSENRHTGVISGHIDHDRDGDVGAVVTGDGVAGSVAPSPRAQSNVTSDSEWFDQRGDGKEGAVGDEPAAVEDDQVKDLSRQGVWDSQGPERQDRGMPHSGGHQSESGTASAPWNGGPGLYVMPVSVGISGQDRMQTLSGSPQWQWRLMFLLGGTGLALVLCLVISMIAMGCIWVWRPLPLPHFIFPPVYSTDCARSRSGEADLRDKIDSEKT